MTGYSETQVDRLIRRKRDVGRVVARARTQPVFPRTYTAEDVVLIAEVDNAEGRRTGGALKKTLADMFRAYRDARFERLSQISVSHLYNLRGSRVYQSRSIDVHENTDHPRRHRHPQEAVSGGSTRIPSRGFSPSGDMDKHKGVYHVNLVDEVTQDEIVVTVEGISEEFRGLRLRRHSRISRS